MIAFEELLFGWLGMVLMEPERLVAIDVRVPA